MYTGAKVYIGDTFSALGNNIIRATENIVRLGENSFQARQVKVHSHKALALALPLSDGFFNRDFSFYLLIIYKVTTAPPTE